MKTIKFVTLVYHKPTFTGIFRSFKSFVPDIQKQLIADVLQNRCSQKLRNIHRFIVFLKSTFSLLKCGLIETLFHRNFSLFSNYENFHREIEILKSIFKHNNITKNFPESLYQKHFE